MASTTIPYQTASANSQGNVWPKTHTHIRRAMRTEWWYRESVLHLSQRSVVLREANVLRQLVGSRPLSEPDLDLIQYNGKKHTRHNAATAGGTYTTIRFVNTRRRSCFVLLHTDSVGRFDSCEGVNSASFLSTYVRGGVGPTTTTCSATR